MRSKLGTVAAIAAFVALVPGAAFAQQSPDAPDRTSMNEAPGAGPAASVDLCGTTPDAAFGPTTANGLPAQPTVFPKDTTGVSPVDVSEVTGTVAHVEGPLVLLRVPQLPAAGAPSTASKMAVVKLPDNCAQMPAEGAQISAIGQAKSDGILEADLIEPA